MAFDAPLRFEHYIGTVGSAVEIKKRGDGSTIVTKKGGNIYGFRLALDYTFETGGSEWVDVSIFNEGLQATAVRELYKGAKVAIQGTMETREVNGKVYKTISALRIGVIEWLRRDQLPEIVDPGQPTADELDF